MEHREGLAAIIVLTLVTSMALSASTTTVSAATPPTVNITTERVRDNSYVFITLTVTNPATATENIENIEISDVTGGGAAKFTGGIFGENVAENLDNVADNLIRAGAEMAEVAENLRQALSDLQNAGLYLELFADNLKLAGEKLSESDNTQATDAGIALYDAATELRWAAENLQVEPLNLLHIAGWMDNAAFENYATGNKNIEAAADNLKDITTHQNYYVNAGENLEQAAENLYWAARSIRAGDFRAAAAFLDNVADDIERTGWNLTAAHENSADLKLRLAGSMLDNDTAPCLKTASDYMDNAAENIRKAGAKLSWIENHYIDNAEYIMALNSPNVTEHERLLLDNFIDNIRLAGAAMNAGVGADNDNILLAGDALDNAATAQDLNTRWPVWQGTLLASNIIGYNGESVTNTIRYWIGVAGDNLMTKTTVNLTNAASAFDNAGSRLDAAGDKIKDTAGEITPSGSTCGWAAENCPSINGLRLSAITDVLDGSSDNTIAPGQSKTFKFLWKAPDIATEKDHTIRVWLYDTDNDLLKTSDFTVTVDGLAPTLTITVTQENVVDYLGSAVDNLIGQVYDDNKATLTITSDEEIESLGTVTIENFRTQWENLVIPFDNLVTSDNLVFTYEFYTTDWLVDNVDNARVKIEGPCATDIYGLENEQTAYCYFEFDTLDPWFENNGLGIFSQTNDTTVMTQPGTDNLYQVSSVKEDWTVTGRAEDNDNRSDNGEWAMTTIYFNDTALTTNLLPDDNFTAVGDLSEGVNTIEAKAVDRVGLSTESSIENVFIDNTATVSTFVSIGGKTWSDNGIRISDNTPSIQLKLSDPGYPTTGWGIPKENVQVELRSTRATEAGAIENLENSLAWDFGAATGTYNWENTYDNIDAGTGEIRGLQSGTYWIVLLVSDNIHENENHAMSFIVDVTAPSGVTLVANTEVLDPDDMEAFGSATNKTSMVIRGYASESGSTIKIYAPDENTLKGTTTASTTLTAGQGYLFSTTVTLSEGKNQKIYIQEVDVAGNPSTKELLSTKTVDATAPTVTVTAPTTGTSTSSTSVVVSGTVTDTIADYDELVVVIDSTGAFVAKNVYLESDGSFSTTVPLDEGNNIINVVATDTATNQTISSVTVKRTVTPWTMYAMIAAIVAIIIAAIAVLRRR